MCGAVTFQLTGDLPSIYQCHCSLCRKVSGSSSNSALIVARSHFQWRSGENQIKSFATPSGFKSEFCCHCGSPVPNLSADGQSYWVPAGLMSEPISTQVSAHVYVDSRANWDTGFLSDDVDKFAQMPPAIEAG
uniref:GFA family protein n=1 Tax=Thaumasiovibrio subtropicus TaxID=1891207 RepID=UPI000B352026|nr:GFA family protein [Thaumasiovibrio subtropicus]